jgi:NADH-quinone oxidoreductase subunit J
MELSAALFYLLSGMTAISAVGVVLTQNIVRAATWLLFALAGTAGIFFLLGADFVGSTQLLIYVGGTLVLVVFGVMLTAQTPFISMRVGAAEWAIALGVGLLLYGVLVLSLSGVPAPPEPPDRPRQLASSTQLGLGLLGARQVTPDRYLTGIPPDYERSRTKVAYLLPFEIVSVHLLVVLIGAGYLARAKRRRGANR